MKAVGLLDFKNPQHSAHQKYEEITVNRCTNILSGRCTPEIKSKTAMTKAAFKKMKEKKKTLFASNST
jgi:hypothetical protein